MKKKIFARKQPNHDGHQVVYEKGGSRSLHHFPEKKSSGESPPHGAGSYHDQEHHRQLIERMEAYLRNQA
jgi:hypothetical protein